MATEMAIPQKERWTYSDYVNLTPPDSYGFQVIRGELIVSPSPKRRHQRAVLSLVRILDTCVNEGQTGEVFVAPFDVVLDADRPDPENIVQPDIAFVSKERLHIVTDDHIKGAPDLVVEVLSGSTARYDRVRKMSVYKQFGVKRYWIVDADQKVLEAFDLSGDAPVRIAACADADVFAPEMFPGLDIPLSDLWYPETDGEG